MKLRNQLLAVFCLLIFVAFGVLYFRSWVVQKPFAIILFISDGLTTGNITAARLYVGGSDQRLTLETLPNLALISTHANDFAVPDSAAAATALATGVKGNHRNLAVATDGKPLKSILDFATKQGRAIGLITTGNLTDPSLAAFYAHAVDSREVENTALQFLDYGKIDVALGGGASDFIPQSKGGRRRDGRDLTLELRQKGYDVIRSKAELENTPLFRNSNLVGIFNNGNLAFSNQIESGSQQPTLSDMVRRAIELLQNNRSGYLLVVDAALISRAAERNDGEHVIIETIEFDHALATALRYAGDKALIIAVGKHAIGGMNLNGYPLRQDHGITLLGTNSFGYPSITWATGPNGSPPSLLSASLEPSIGSNPEQTSLIKPESKAAFLEDEKPSQLTLNTKIAPAAFFTPVAINNANDVVAIGIGPGSQALRGFLDNTTIFQILKDNL